jgi:hypothetical protein
MANLICSAKCGNDWTQNELRVYNIQVVEQSLVKFFNQSQRRIRPLPPTLHNFCETTDRALAPDDDTYKLLHYFDLAHNPKVGQAAAIDNFAARLLETLGYASGRRVIVTRETLPLIICGMQCSARADVCVCDDKDYVLLVQENKGLDNPEDPEPQLIAEAIAAYQRNNFIRDRVHHIPTLDEITFPGITLVGTFPTFYKIKVTAELCDAVMGGAFPTKTSVYYTPRLPHRNEEGMKPLENRATILRYYQAFKAFV